MLPDPDAGDTSLVTDAEIVTAVRQALEDEDPETGLAPTTVEAVDVELPLRPEPPDSITLEALTGTQLLGSLPTEALYWVLVAKFGPEWPELDPDAMLFELLQAGTEVDAAGFGRFMALHSIMSAPSDSIGFWRSWRAFGFLTLNLMGIPVRWDEDHVPTPLQMALAIHVVTELRPAPMESDVLRFVAASAITHELWVMPRELKYAQPYVLEALRYREVPITADDVLRVKTAVAELVRQGTAPEDLPEPMGAKDVQVRLLLEFFRDRDAALEKAGRMRDMVWDKSKTLLRSALGQDDV